MDDQKRIFLWAAPRTISTAVFRAMMNRPNIKVLLEPFANSYYFGEDRISARYINEPWKEGQSYADIKAVCEQRYPEHQEVFVKDMAYYLSGKLDDLSYLPENFQHTFLIRDPYKTIKSLYKLSIDEKRTGWNSFDPSEAGFKELYQLFYLIRQNLGYTPIVIDADDLLEAPEEILTEYCKRIGISFDHSMLEWPSLEATDIYNSWMPWFEGALTSKGFLKPVKKGEKRRNSSDGVELPDDVLECMNENEIYYEKLHQYRITCDLKHDL